MATRSSLFGRFNARLSASLACRPSGSAGRCGIVSCARLWRSSRRITGATAFQPSPNQWTLACRFSSRAYPAGPELSSARIHAAPLESRAGRVPGASRLLGIRPRLRGHGTSPQDLAERSYQDWLHSVDRGYAIMSSICRGWWWCFSTGAGLALHLAARVRNLAGVSPYRPRCA